MTGTVQAPGRSWGRVSSIAIPSSKQGLPGATEGRLRGAEGWGGRASEAQTGLHITHWAQFLTLEARPLSWPRCVSEWVTANRI